MKKLSIALLTLFVFQATYAQEVVSTKIVSSGVQNIQAANSSIISAKDWDLSSKEWVRYQQLMKGADGLWYKQLTPASVLGVNATTPKEQEHYADIVAKEEHDRLAREISFNNAVYRALLKLYPNEPVIKPFNLAPFNPINKNKKIMLGQSSLSMHNMTVQSGDHLVLFVNTQAGLDFATLPKLLAIIKTTPGVVLDIYAVGKVADGALRSWAALNAIPVAMVNKEQITLNHNDGKLQSVAGSKKTVLPYLLLIRHGQSIPVNAWSLV